MFSISIILGYLFSALIGISLGSIGGGGSILTVPILVYLFNVEPVLATSYSLFIVGSTSFAGAIQKFTDGKINFRVAAVFGLPSIMAIYFTRKVLLPSIPYSIFTIGEYRITKPLFLLLLFAVLMLTAAIPMIRGKRLFAGIKQHPEKLNIPVLMITGIAVGMLTGLAGAGGGFLIIPSLVFLGGLEMKTAIGTSLLIICTNTFVGFFGDLGHYIMNWTLLLSVTLVAVLGIFVGHSASKKIPGEILKIFFGWFVLGTGCYILLREIIFFRG